MPSSVNGQDFSADTARNLQALPELYQLINLVPNTEVAERGAIRRPTNLGGL